jgi:hypothetical protein
MKETGIRARFTLVLTVTTLTGMALPGVGRSQSVSGRVLDEATGTPVPMAVVVLLGSDESPVTQGLSGEDGAFSLSAPGGGFYSLRVSGLGLADFETSIFGVGDGEAVHFEIRVPARPLELETLLVQVQGDRGRDRFRERSERGVGFFLNREQLDLIDPVDMVDIFRAVEGVQMSWGFVRYDDGGNRPMPTVRAGPHGCMTYMLDDRPVRGSIGDNRSPLALFPLSGLRMEDIQAVEVYRDIWEVPAELRNSAFRSVWGEHGAYHELTCGITVFRTRARW